MLNAGPLKTGQIAIRVNTITKCSLGALMTAALACSASAVQADKDKVKDKGATGSFTAFQTPDLRLLYWVFPLL
jgi:hypothetical protein